MVKNCTTRPDRRKDMTFGFKTYKNRVLASASKTEVGNLFLTRQVINYSFCHEGASKFWISIPGKTDPLLIMQTSTGAPEKNGITYSNTSGNRWQINSTTRI